jgi:CheY-like chemotaxis protein
MKKILIIEDDQVVANIYRNKLTVEGYEVEIAYDGQVGLELLRQCEPDAVILDLMLPTVTGVELMKKVRADPAFRYLPIIVFSNTYLTNTVQEAWKAGATKCLSKANCLPQQLLEVVRNVIGNGAARAAAAPKSDPHASEAAPADNPAASREHDADFRPALRQTLAETIPATLTTLRASLRGVTKSENETTRVEHLREMYRRAHSLTANAGLAGMLPMAQLSDAFEALLKELYEKPKNLNTSTVRTLASAVDFLGVLFKQGTSPQNHEVPLAGVLVVDDEAISRRALTHALEKAKLKPVTVEDPRKAYDLLTQRKFDLVFLDVDMPGMNGFELCAKLRQLPAHKETPVVFVTNLNNLESRANSTISGGNDFIAKPFLSIELSVKALVCLLRRRLVPSASS